MNDFRYSALIPVVISLSACAGAPAHLQSADISSLEKRPLIVVYAEPETPLNAILSQPARGGALGVLLDAHEHDVFLAKLGPCQATAQKLKIQDREYTTVHEWLSAVPWLKNVTWKRIQRADGDYSNLTLRENTGDAVVIALDSQTAVYSAVDRVIVGIHIQIFTSTAAEYASGRSFKSDELSGYGYLNYPGSKNGFGFPTASDPNLTAVVKSRIDAVCGGDGTLFLQGIAGAMASLQGQLTYFLTGTGAVPQQD